ncbi:hypothetical protein NDU88_000036 [Pleurodeles waltl]|uniref:Uncharacterized protein n=1 Tax=Pleurodeles waltl TaxID=8319 RepID=A0AAV7KLE0_PLEWA|nr:hypothetical protein NDU88_000036 [Pleurodeles waltl]
MYVGGGAGPLILLSRDPWMEGAGPPVTPPGRPRPSDLSSHRRGALCGAHAAHRPRGGHFLFRVRPPPHQHRTVTSCCPLLACAFPLPGQRGSVSTSIEHRDVVGRGVYFRVSGGEVSTRTVSPQVLLPARKLEERRKEPRLFLHPVGEHLRPQSSGAAPQAPGLRISTSGPRAQDQHLRPQGSGSAPQAPGLRGSTSGPRAQDQHLRPQSSGAAPQAPELRGSTSGPRAQGQHLRPQGSRSAPQASGSAPQAPGLRVSTSGPRPQGQHLRPQASETPPQAPGLRISTSGPRAQDQHLRPQGSGSAPQAPKLRVSTSGTKAQGQHLRHQSCPRRRREPGHVCTAFCSVMTEPGHKVWLCVLEEKDKPLQRFGLYTPVKIIYHEGC